jgi:hypothetical protein
MATDPDPIGVLVEAMHRDGKPPLSWIVAWSEGGAREPVYAAWDASTNPRAMLTLVLPFVPAWRLCNVADHMPGCYELRVEGRFCTEVLAGAAHAPEVAALLRRMIPHPPTLEMLLARVHA